MKLVISKNTCVLSEAFVLPELMNLLAILGPTVLKENHVYGSNVSNLLFYACPRFLIPPVRILRL
jgi:hypothetical protein